jgi:hypothetical protein
VFFNEQRQAIVGRLIAISPAMWRIAQRAETIRETIIELPVSEWPICHGITGRRNARSPGLKGTIAEFCTLVKYQSLFNQVGPVPKRGTFLAVLRSALTVFSARCRDPQPRPLLSSYRRR